MRTAAHLNADERGIIVRCPRCDRANRVPFSRLGQTGHCAQCKSPLPALSAPVEIDDTAAFAALTLQSALPVLVDFWAPWCGPCQMVAPEVAKLAAMTAGELLVAKVNTEDQPGIGAAMNIRSIPTFAVFVGGREVERASGGMPADQLLAFVRRAAGSRR
jgi:thioredoxin 2